MKIITLNVWGGKMKKELASFLEGKRSEVDIFCLQEVYSHANESHKDIPSEGDDLDLFQHLEKLLPDHVGYFCPTVEHTYGIAVFVRKSYCVDASGEISVYDCPGYSGAGGNHPRKMQWLEVSGGELGEAKISLMNVHGLWNGQGKTDTPDRIEQSRRIRDFVGSTNSPVVLCGDFNLLPDTQSLALLGKGLRNLVAEYGVTSTRTSFYTKPEKFADYVFVSPEVEVVDFRVLPDEVSDHAPLLVEVKL